MYSMSSNDILEQYNKLLALNSSLEGRLQELEQVLISREEEIDLLHSMLSASNAQQSKTDNQADELKLFQHNVARLQKQVASSSPSLYATGFQVADTDSMVKQFADLRLRYTYMQTQLTDLQEAWTGLNNRSILLQQQNSRIAELESLLENANKEIDALR